VVSPRATWLANLPSEPKIDFVDARSVARPFLDLVEVARVGAALSTRNTLCEAADYPPDQIGNTRPISGGSSCSER